MLKHYIHSILYCQIFPHRISLAHLGIHSDGYRGRASSVKAASCFSSRVWRSWIVTSPTARSSALCLLLDVNGTMRKQNARAKIIRKLNPRSFWTVILNSFFIVVCASVYPCAHVCMCKCTWTSGLADMSVFMNMSTERS